MKMPSVVLCASVLLMLTTVSPGVANQSGRLAGTVVDPEGNPLEGVKVTCVGVEVQFEATRTSNKKGRFTLLLLDATEDYLLRLEKEGFITIEEPFDPLLGDTMRETWTMVPGQGGGRAQAGTIETGVAPAAVSGQGQAGRLYGDAYESFRAGDLDEALTRFQKVIELQPDLKEAHQAVALIYSQQGLYQESLAEADRVLELQPDDPLALKIKLEAYRGLGDLEQQEELIDTLIGSGPDPTLAPVIFNSGVAKVQAGDLAGGATRFEQAKEADPGLLATYSALARVYFDMGRVEESIDEARKYLEQDPDNGEVLGVLYLAYDQMGMEAEAAETFEALKASNPAHMVTVFEQMGVTAFNNGETSRAQELFEMILEIDPDHPRGHYHLALCYLNEGDTAKAKELLTRFLELAPDDPEVSSARAMLESL